jgi:hypothetical protein
MKAKELAEKLLEYPDFDVYANVVYHQGENPKPSTKLVLRVCKPLKMINIF